MTKWIIGLVVTFAVGFGAYMLFWPSSEMPAPQHRIEAKARPVRAVPVAEATPDPLAPVVSDVSADAAVMTADSPVAVSYRVSEKGKDVEVDAGSVLEFSRAGFADCDNKAKKDDCALSLLDNGTTINGRIAGIPFTVASGAVYTAFFHDQQGKRLDRKIMIGNVEAGTVAVSNLGAGRYAVAIKVGSLKVTQAFVFDDKGGVTWDLDSNADEHDHLVITRS